MKTLREILENEKYGFELDGEIGDFINMIDFIDETDSFEEWLRKYAEASGIEKEKIDEKMGEGFESDVPKILKSIYEDLFNWRNKK